MKEASYYEKRKDGKVRCNLCFHYCLLEEGELGLCLARRNVEGKLIAETYAKLVAAHMDPIEKKPLYHFHPGQDVLSVGANGCNLACPFCQNAEIALRLIPGRGEHVPPEKLVEIARNQGSKGIAYTYTEPLIWFEYLMDTCRLAHQEGLYNVIVSNGIINQEPLEELLPHLDAANVDLKGSTEFYRKVLKGDRKSVIRTIRILSVSGVHLEVTNLLIPGKNDSDDDIEELAAFIRELDPNIPLHLSRYFPYHGYKAPQTPVDTMLKAYELARKHLPYVYLGNVMAALGQNTLCPSCSATLVERMGYQTKLAGIANGRCASCGREVDLIL